MHALEVIVYRNTKAAAREWAHDYVDAKTDEQRRIVSLAHGRGFIGHEHQYYGVFAQEFDRVFEQEQGHLSGHVLKEEV